MAWSYELKERLAQYLHLVGQIEQNVLPISIKIRVTSGCFHREHSPVAYKLIDEYVKTHPERNIRLVEHENGPELLVYVTLITAGLNLSAQLINVVTAIIKARSEGIKKGDSPKDSIEVIVRGFDKKGNLKEENILKINSSDKIKSADIKDILDATLNKFVE